MDRCECISTNEKKIEIAKKKLSNITSITKTAKFFKILGDGTRFKIIIILLEGEMCVCDIAAFLKVSESAVSHQLRMLRQLQLVSNRREGPILYYRLNGHHVNKIIQIALNHTRE
jgi:DNA-binding transcriptional ArsR family regulator